MKILIVNNGSHPPTLIEEFFKSDQVTVLSYDSLQNIDGQRFDCAILSGSNNFPVVGNEQVLTRELEFIRLTDIPILGICFGFELIVTAFGGTLKRLPEKAQGIPKMTIETPDFIFHGIDRLFVYESHRWIADVVPESLIILAKSEHGVGAVKHKTKKMYGFQFHPEKLTRETSGKKILENFRKLVEFGNPVSTAWI